MKKKTLLIFVSHASFFISHRLELAILAKKKGYDVKIVLGEIDSDLKILKEKEIDCFYLPVYRGGINPFKDAKSLFLIFNLFRKIKPDIVHLVTIKPYLYGGVIARIAKVPCVVSAVSGLGSLFIGKSLKNKFLRILFYPIYKFAFNHSNQFIILQNHQDLKFLQNWGVLNINKVKLLKGSGVNLKEFIPTKEIETNMPVVCFAARLLKDKGIYEFISAAEILNKLGVRAKFVVAGDLDLKNPTSLNLKELNKLKENKNIEIIGYQKNIPKLFNQSNIICLPSYREGFPKTLIEAAAAGRAVITTDVPGCRDAIIPNKTGLLVQPKNSKKLADAIQYLIQNPKLRASMGNAGRELAKKEFKIENIIQGHLDIYNDLLKA